MYAMHPSLVRLTAFAFAFSIVGCAADEGPDDVGAAEASELTAVTSRQVVRLSSGGTQMPGAVFETPGRLSVFGANYTRGVLVGVASTNGGRTFSAPQALALAGTSDVTGARTHLRDTLYVVQATAAGGVLAASRVRGNVMDPFVPVTINGTPPRFVPYWPQAVGLPDGRTLLAFVEPQTRGFLAVDDGSGLRFTARPLPNTSGVLRGVLAHVGTTTNGSWVVTHQTADAAWAFTSFVQMSKDGGATWSRPENLQPADPNVHDAFPLARRSGGVDLYYLRAGSESAFSVYRRSLSEQGVLGREERVTAADVGHVEKPQARRLADGRIHLLFAVRRTEADYDLASTILASDAPM